MDNMLLKLRAIHEMNLEEDPPSQCSLYEIIQNEIEHFSHAIDLKQTELVSSIGYQKPVLIDKRLVKIIISNLLENAIQFYRPHVRNKIQLILTVKDSYCFLEITDEGEGMHPIVLDKIFQPFFRGSEKSNGNGLGLFLVKNAVNKLKGSIEVTSKYGFGSKFNVKLPVVMSLSS
jgi:signal transduction histidine kinase